MKPADPDRDESSPALRPEDRRFWQAFAQAAGFDEELRDLIAAGEVDPADFDASDEFVADDGSPDELLAAARLHEALLAALPVAVERRSLERSVVERPAPRRNRSRSWIVAGALAALGTAAAVLIAVRLGDDAAPVDDASQEIASAERLAESWIAVRESAFEADALDADAYDAAEFGPPGLGPVDAAAFEDAPDWLALAVAREAELAADSAPEATP